MQIRLLGNNSTFGIPYTSAPEQFTTGEMIEPVNRGYRRYDTVLFEVSEGKAYFVNVVSDVDNRIDRGSLSFGMLVSSKYREQKHVTLSSLNPETKFIDCRAFPEQWRLPVKELKGRNIAVLHSEGQYTTVGSLGQNKRRDSFYCGQVALHPDLSDREIENLAEKGFFRAPGFSVPYPDGEARKDIFGGGDYLITNVIDMAGVNETVAMLEKKVSDMGECLFEMRRETESGWEYISSDDKLQKHLNIPFVQLNQDVNQDARPRCSGVLTKIYSPDAGNDLMLIRHPDTKIPFISKEKAEYEMHIAYLENYKQHPDNLLSISRLSPGIKAAIEYNLPYKKASNFCKRVITRLEGLRNQFKNEKTDVGGSTESAGNTALEKSLTSLKFVKKYLDDIRCPVGQLLYSDKLVEQTKKSGSVEGVVFQQFQQQNSLKQNILDQEKQLLKNAFETETISKTGYYFPLFNHTMMLSSLMSLIDIKADLDVPQLMSEAKQLSEDIAINRTESLVALAGHSILVD